MSELHSLADRLEVGSILKLDNNGTKQKPFGVADQFESSKLLVCNINLVAWHGFVICWPAQINAIQPLLEVHCRHSRPTKASKSSLIFYSTGEPARCWLYMVVVALIELLLAVVWRVELLGSKVGKVTSRLSIHQTCINCQSGCAYAAVS